MGSNETMQECLMQWLRCSLGLYILYQSARLCLSFWFLMVPQILGEYACNEQKHLL